MDKEPIKEFEFGRVDHVRDQKEDQKKIELRGGLTSNMNTRIAIRELEENIQEKQLELGSRGLIM